MCSIARKSAQLHENKGVREATVSREIRKSYSAGHFEAYL